MVKYPICLNMIVKNEEKTLPRLFSTIHKYIDYYIISDTGSTDNTKQIIKELGKKYNIPGEIHDDPWENFAVNRQKALMYVNQNPECKYAMIIDADEQFKLGSDAPSPKKLKKQMRNFQDHCYHIKRKYTGSDYYLPFLLDTIEYQWNWKGVVHNYIEINEHPNAKHHYLDEKLIYIHVNMHEGSKSQNVTPKEKYLRDAELLKKEIEKNPKDTRSWFYLGQSYYDAGDYDQAYDAYRQREKMGGWNEEVYYSKLRMGCCLILLNQAYGDILEHLLDAYEYRPTRAESLYELTKYCYEQKMYQQGYLFSSMAIKIPRPENDLLFVNHSVYDYNLYDHHALCAYYIKKYDEAKKYWEMILMEGKYPESYRSRYEKNLKFVNI